ncbi:hypothetical protein ACWCXK_06065 [Streptomyces sp. NPDC001739]
MEATTLATSVDSQIEAAFGCSVTALHHDIENPAVRRVLELRAMLAVVEQHLDLIRGYLHRATAPGRDRAVLASEDLTVDARWLAAAGRSRIQYAQAISTLLSAMPTASHQKPAPTATATAARSEGVGPAQAGTAPPSRAATQARTTAAHR